MLFRSSKEELENLGGKYFQDLRSRRNKHLTEERWLFEKPYFAFYSNSDDEAVGFWESWSESVMDQVELVQYLQKYFDEKGHNNLVVRLHPNLTTKSEAERKRWSSIKDSPHSRVIESNEKISSYEILDQAIGVISFGSTIGLEAAFHRKPSAILADCWYDEIGVADKLHSIEDLIHWIEITSQSISPNEITNRHERSLVRGLWLECAGNNFESTQLKELSWGSWEVIRCFDVKLKRSRITEVISILTNRLKRISRGLQP